jgi:predicted metalloprotease
MRWTPGGSDEHIEDRRGMRPGRVGGGVGIGAILIVLLLSWLTGRDLTSFLGVLDNSGGGEVAAVPTGDAPGNDQARQFATFVLNDNQETWARILGAEYRPTNLVLFTEATQSGCGMAQAASGPFYCPGDEKVYIDFSFYDELHRRFGAPGDFAQAYVLAHEVGHHVQNVLGIEQQMRAAQQRNPRAANELSVRMELQADCFAGVWGHHSAQKGVLEPGDVEEGLTAAASIGDDRIQKEATGRVSPESFTHGTSAQRVEWLKRGLQSGDVKTCDTFQSR